MRRPRVLLLPTVLVLAGLAACATPEPEPTPTEHAVIGIGGQGGSSDQPAADPPTSGAGPIDAEGLPIARVLVGCDEVVDASVNQTGFDTQWRWEFVCTSRDAFDASVAALDADGSLTRTQNMVAGTDAYLSESHHWIGERGGVLDVDLKLNGRPDDLEVVYLVTLATS